MYLLSIILVVLLFPLFFNIDSLFVKEHKKLYFNTKFLFIKIISGYVLFENGISVHISKRKAIMIELINVKNIDIKVNPLKGLVLYNMSIVNELGFNDNLFLTGVFTNFVHTIYYFIQKLFKIKKKHLKVELKTNLYANDSRLNIFITLKIFSNVLMIIILLIKQLIRKIYNETRNGKNKQNDRNFA